MTEWRELLDAVKAGEPAAGPSLITVVAPLLDSYALRIGQDLSQREREDAVEKALTEVVRRIDSYDEGTATLPSWARAFVRHAIADIRRGSREQPTGPSELQRIAGNGVEAPMEGVEGKSDDGDLLSPQAMALTSLMTTVLSEADQLLITLHVHQKLTFEEISAVLGGERPPSAAALRKRYERGRRRLRNAAAAEPNLKHFMEDITYD